MHQYVNINNEWPRVRTIGLEIEKVRGALTLRKLPGLPRRLAGIPGSPSVEPKAAGIAAGPDGAIFISDPQKSRVFRIDAANRVPTPLGCVCSDSGSAVGQLSSPMGLAYQWCRNRLLIADTGNRCIQVVDPIQERVVAAWGQTWPYDPPRPCHLEQGLDAPVQLACDRSGNVYVIDHLAEESREEGTPAYCLVKLTADGRRMDNAFCCDGAEPVHVAVADQRAPDADDVECGAEDRERVFVLAITEHLQLLLFVFDTNGTKQTSAAFPLLDLSAELIEEFATQIDDGWVSAIFAMRERQLQIALSDPKVREKIQTSAVSQQMNFEKSIKEINSLKSQNEYAKAQKIIDRLLPWRRGSFDIHEIVTAFTVIDGTAILSIASKVPRVWCFEIGLALQKDSPNEVELSWLPSHDQPAVALTVRGNPSSSRSTAEVLLSAGPGRSLYALPHRGAYRSQGAFLAGPFEGNRAQVTRWCRLRFDAALSDKARMQVFTLARSEKEFLWSPPVRLQARRFPNWFRVESQPNMFDRLGFSPAEEETVEEDVDEFDPIRRGKGDRIQRINSQTPEPDPDRTPGNTWFAIPENQFDALLHNSGGTTERPNDQFWIFGLIAGDGESSPSFRQVRLEHDEDGWLSDLPDVFQQDPDSRSFVRSLLALLESRFEDVTESTDRLPTLFSADSMTARYGQASAELEWLRSALALPTTVRFRDRKKDIDRNRQMFADGPYWLARRGTREGLRRLFWLATGVEVVIDEPSLAVTPWRLGNPLSGVVFGTPEMNGLPLSTEAECGGWPEIIGLSTLNDPDHPGPRLPDDTAHHVVIRGYESDLIDRQLRQLVELTASRLVPAHNSYFVQVIEPRARVGVQARLGIDAVVARSHSANPMTLNEPPGPEFQIDPSPNPPTVGAAHLSTHTVLI